MQNHTMPTRLEELAKLGAPVLGESEARWCRNVPKTCLIFVHGFGGRPVETWGQFPELAMEHPAFAYTDIVFLGYESRSLPAPISVATLFRVLRLLAERPSEVLRAVKGPERRKDFNYETIVLVGHSLGGALVRDMAMIAKMEEFAWSERLRLALFAPAHKGANVIELFDMGAGAFKWFKILRVGAVARCPVLKDLTPGSEYLTNLLKTAEGIGVHCTTRASFVVHAKNDQIVNSNLFYKDPPLRLYDNADHRSCCKPIRATFEHPLLDLASVLA